MAATRLMRLANGALSIGACSAASSPKCQHLTPTGSLYRWLLPQLDVARLEWALAGWIATTRPKRDHEAIALDGKTVCGAGTATAAQPTLLSIATHTTHETLVQVHVPPTTNEIPIAPELLGWLALHDRLITADAAHCQTEFARAVVDCGGHYLLCLKRNQPVLYADVVAYFADPHARCTEASTLERHRGRREHRTLRVTTELTDYLDAFPGVAQVVQITRSVQRKGRVQEEEVAYYLTSAPPTVADADALLAHIRAHWGIESHHWIRDTVFAEDRSRLRSGAPPQIMAALRNAAITLIRRSGRQGITAARRHLAAHPTKAFTLIRHRFPARC